MKNRWIASASLSVVRAIGLTGSAAAVGPLVLPGVDEATSSTLQKIGLQMDRRLVDASVRTSRFHTELIDELTAADADAMPSVKTIEWILVRCGVSMLSVDQIAGGIHRDLSTAATTLQTANPRLAEQLRLRMGPLRSGFESYGPGVLRSVGRTVWNGPPPDDWWPKTVTIHGVMPWRGGAADAHPVVPAVWIESMLTDRDPRVPEWLRLSFQILRVASGRHTGSGSGAGGGAGAQTLPWSVGMIPVLLDAAGSAGAIPPPGREQFDQSVAIALQSWRASPGAGFDSQPELAQTLSEWWWSIRDIAAPFPKKLQSLRLMIGR